MPKPRNLVPSIRLEVSIREDLHAMVNLHLFSELEQRVPQGKYKEFFEDRIREFFAARQLDLAPYANCDPGVFVVSGSRETLAMLQQVIKGETP